jgi:hypothetical protein
MTIRYTNGQILEAVLLSRTPTTMRLAVQGHDDIVVLTRVTDVWVSDECDAVQVGFSWTEQVAKTEVTEADCICSHDLAAHLTQMLSVGGDDLHAKKCAALDAHFISAVCGVA